MVVSGKGKKEIVRDSRTGLEYWYTGEIKTRSHLRAFAKMAFDNDLTSVLVEGGQQLASSFLESGLVNRMYLFYGNKILGQGKEGIVFSAGLPVNKCICLKKKELLLFHDTVAITGIPDNRGQ